MSIVFFQAEDGIRDFHVTGVQTCALPISESCLPHASTSSPLQNPTLLEDPRCRQLKPIRPAQPPCIHEEIGRASCRERAWALGATLSPKNQPSRPNGPEQERTASAPAEGQ